MRSRLVYNAIRTPDGTVLESTQRYDYQEYTDKVSGHTYMVDGGLDYRRRGNDPTASYEDISVYLDDPFGEIREVFTWGSYGVDGDEPLRLIKLKDLTTEHIYNIFKSQTLARWIGDLMIKELAYRGE